MSLALTLKEISERGQDKIVLATKDPAIIAAVRRAIARRLARSDRKKNTANRAANLEGGSGERRWKVEELLTQQRAAEIAAR